MMHGAFCPNPPFAPATTRRGTPHYTARTRCATHPVADDEAMTEAVRLAPHLRGNHIVGLGLAALDMIAGVSTYPAPDSKVRTTFLRTTGGGNAANSVTAARRLGVPTRLVTQVGDDANGSAVLAELARDGVDMTHARVARATSTPFTYVLVAEHGGTRTCVATVPHEQLQACDMHAAMLHDASVLLLDGRHTLAAIALARLAHARGVPVLLDVERMRPHLEELLPLADFVVTSAAFPQLFAPQAPTALHAMQMVLRATRGAFVVTTRGARGCTLLRRRRGGDHDHYDAERTTRAHGVDVVTRHVHGEDNEWQVMECSAWPDATVVDTTGAGDAFIGGIAYAVATGMDTERMLRLASYVAMRKLSCVGSRAGLPRREDVPSDLL